MKKYIYFWVDFDQNLYVGRAIDFALNAQIENIVFVFVLIVV